MFFWRTVHMTPRLHISPVLVLPEDYSWFEMHLALQHRCAARTPTPGGPFRHPPPRSVAATAGVRMGRRAAQRAYPWLARAGRRVAHGYSCP